jgi:ketosteroid isomerase-like protein
MSEIIDDIIHIETEQAAAFNRSDLDAAIGCFDQEMVGFSSTKHERLAGLEALRETFEYYLKQAGKVEYNIVSPMVQVVGETAIVSFYWTVAFGDSPHRREINGRGSHVFARKNGQWKIVHEHFSRAHHRE